MGTKHTWTNADGLTRYGGPRTPEGNNATAEKAVDKEVTPSVPGGGNRRTRGAKTITGNMLATAATASGTTWHSTVALPVKFTHIAPIYQSVETGAITITSCAAASVASLTDYPHPTATYVPVLFGGATSGSMPARAAANQPTPYVGDMTALQAVDSTDGSGMYYVAIRTYFAGTGYSYFAASSSVEASSALFGGQTWRNSTQAVDGVGTPTSFVQTATTNNMVLVGVAYRAEDGALSVAFLGDSTQRGQNGATALAGAGVRAVGSLSTAAKPVTCVNIGCAGAVPSDYEANGERVLLATGAKVAVYRVSSINEPVTTQAIADKHFALTLKFVDFCEANSITPILETSIPQNLGSVSADRFRLALNSRVIAYGAKRNILVSDAAAAIEDPTATYRMLPAYNSGDNSHPNDAGYEAIKVPLMVALQQLT